MIMANSILRKIASDLRSSEFFTIMMDECTDVSNKEQVTNLFEVVLLTYDDDIYIGSFGITMGG